MSVRTSDRYQYHNPPSICTFVILHYVHTLTSRFKAFCFRRCSRTLLQRHTEIITTVKKVSETEIIYLETDVQYLWNLVFSRRWKIRWYLLGSSTALGSNYIPKVSEEHAVSTFRASTWRYYPQYQHRQTHLCALSVGSVSGPLLYTDKSSHLVSISFRLNACFVSTYF